MLVQRLLVSIALIPAGMFVIARGGVLYGAVVAVILGLAAWEYVKLFQAGGLQPAGLLVMGGVLLLVSGRFLDGFGSAAWMVSLLVLASMTYHLLAFERGRQTAGTDFAVTLAGIFYLGWLGAYLISLRALTDGKWWLLSALPAVWLADGGAYFIGHRFGRRRLSPRLSPNKTWEGYLGGVVVGVIGTTLLTGLWRIGAGPDSALTPARGALLGVIISVLAPLGDLGESMIKRQVGLKDSGHLIPGHGGAFDRIDSWLWAGVIGYYVIVWLFL